MTVIGLWPPKMIKALAAIASGVHDGYDIQPDTTDGGSKETCLFTSLAVRDFLVEIGFRDAVISTCCCVLSAASGDGKQIWSVGIGMPDQEPIPHKFNGHAVVTLPSLGLLIDTTLYPAVRTYWRDVMRGMMALPYHKPHSIKVYDRHPFARADVEITTGRTLTMIWCDRPEIKWRRSIDAARNKRRRVMTKYLVSTFGEWCDE
jgi:hypothetical protein